MPLNKETKPNQTIISQSSLGVIYVFGYMFITITEINKKQNKTKNKNKNQTKQNTARYLV